jgi:hypothetical protein
MPQLDIPVAIMREDDHLTASELLLQELYNHTAMTAIQAHDHIIKKQWNILILFPLRHSQKDAKPKAVPVPLR